MLSIEGPQSESLHEPHRHEGDQPTGDNDDHPRRAARREGRHQEGLKLRLPTELGLVQPGDPVATVGEDV